MNTKYKNTAIIIAILIIGIVIFALQKRPDVKNNETEIEVSIATSTPTISPIATTTIPEIKPISAEQIRSEAWAVFDTYRRDILNHNLAGIKKVAYKLSKVCQDETREKECFDRLDTFTNTIQNLKKELFLNTWFDSKQVILSSGLEVGTSTNGLRGEKNYIYFAREGSTYKILGVFPKSWVWERDESTKNLTDAELALQLQDVFKDVDKDGLVDRSENCKGEMLFIECAPTDPKKQDTDGDGWWDGPDVFLEIIK